MLGRICLKTFSRLFTCMFVECMQILSLTNDVYISFGFASIVRWKCNAKFTLKWFYGRFNAFSAIYIMCTICIQVPVQFVFQHFTSYKIEEKVSYRTDLLSTRTRINFSLVLSHACSVFSGITERKRNTWDFYAHILPLLLFVFCRYKNAKCLHILQIVEIFISFAVHAVRLVCDLFLRGKCSIFRENYSNEVKLHNMDKKK